MVAIDPGVLVANASRLHASAGVVLRALENRASLAVVELEEARDRVAAAAVWALVSAMALALAGVTLTVLVAAIFWDTPQRIIALIILGVVEIAGAATGAWYVTSRWRRWRLLEHSRDQLAKDSACLREILTPGPR